MTNVKKRSERDKLLIPCDELKRFERNTELYNYYRDQKEHGRSDSSIFSALAVKHEMSHSGVRFIIEKYSREFN